MSRQVEVETKQTAPGPEALLFWSFVSQRRPDECWPWVGPRSKNGIPSFELAGEKESVGRLAYRFACGKLSRDETVSRNCQTADCCNPIHFKKSKAPRKRWFHLDKSREDLAQTCALVRGALIAKMEALFTSGAVGAALWQGDNWEPGTVEFVSRFSTQLQLNDHEGALGLLRQHGLHIFGELMRAMFPREFGEDPEIAARLAKQRGDRLAAVLAAGLVPDTGPQRAGSERTALFAKALTRAQTAALGVA